MKEMYIGVTTFDLSIISNQLLHLLIFKMFQVLKEVHTCNFSDSFYKLEMHLEGQWPFKIQANLFLSIETLNDRLQLSLDVIILDL